MYFHQNFQLIILSYVFLVLFFILPDDFLHLTPFFLVIESTDFTFVSYSITNSFGVPSNLTRGLSNLCLVHFLR